MGLALTYILDGVVRACRMVGPRRGDEVVPGLWNLCCSACLANGEPRARRFAEVGWRSDPNSPEVTVLPVTNPTNAVHLRVVIMYVRAGVDRQTWAWPAGSPGAGIR
jgi:hypothetical protein